MLMLKLMPASAFKDQCLAVISPLLTKKADLHKAILGVGREDV